MAVDILILNTAVTDLRVGVAHAHANENIDRSYCIHLDSGIGDRLGRIFMGRHDNFFCLIGSRIRIDILPVNIPQ